MKLMNPYARMPRPARRPDALRVGLLVLLLGALCIPTAQGQVTSVEVLVDAVNNGAPGDLVEVGAGTFELTEPLRPKDGMTIRGAGAGATTITGDPSWTPGTDDLPDSNQNADSANPDAYLFDLSRDETRTKLNGPDGVTISGMTLSGPQLHGAILGIKNDSLRVFDVRVEDVLWSGIRTYIAKGARVHDSEFVDAGGKYGSTGGAIYFTYAEGAEIWNNRIWKVHGERNNYGVKGYQFRNSRIHHNTIRVGFSIEIAHANSHFVEIDHNYMTGPISIPKWRGGSVPEGGYTFHIHHNYASSSYALEWARNGVEVNHNFFDFSVEKDGGNLIANFGKQPAPGPTYFHNNHIKNPGRGIFWSEGVYDNFYFYNNHVIANETATPRTEGFFALRDTVRIRNGSDANGDPIYDVYTADFSTVAIRDNIIEVRSGPERPLMRNPDSYAATIENNRLTGVSDADQYENPQTGAVQGPTGPLAFAVGAYEEYLVDGWEVRAADAPAEVAPVGETVWLRAEVNGRYVAADLNRGGALIADRTWARAWEEFEVTDGADDDPATVALRAGANGRYVVAEPDQNLVAAAEEVGPAERFVWEPNDDGTVCLRSVGTGGYVVAERAGAEPLRADRAACRGWERFAWGAVDGSPNALTHEAEAPVVAAYPNPFNPLATIAYALPQPAHVRLAVYDVLGRRVALLVDGPQGAGAHAARFDGAALPSGTYLWRLEAGATVHVGRMTLLK